MVQPQIEDVIPVIVNMENLQPEMGLGRLCLVLLIVCITVIYGCTVWDPVSVLGTVQTQNKKMMPGKFTV